MPYLFGPARKPQSTEVQDLCELIDHAPMAAVDLLDMLTTAPKAFQGLGRGVMNGDISR